MSSFYALKVIETYFGARSIEFAQAKMEYEQIVKLYYSPGA